MGMADLSRDERPCKVQVLGATKAVTLVDQAQEAPLITQGAPKK